MLDGAATRCVDKQPGFDDRRLPDRARPSASGASYTANDIFRNPSWRKRDADGALRVSPEDARAPRPRRRRAGARSRPRAAAPRRPSRSATRCTPGTRRSRTASASTSPMPTAATHVPGVAPNSLTSSDWRDAFAGTPWHKHVPARIEPVADLLNTRLPNGPFGYPPASRSGEDSNASDVDSCHWWLG